MKPRSRYVWEVMVFVVVANIECDHVEWAIVGVSLIAFLKHVVL